MYSTQKAIEYAKKYWKDYNPEYKTYKGAGGDCANFVSQCLYAGGFPMKTKVWEPSQSAWKGAQSLRLLLKYQKNYKIDNRFDAEASNLQPGDLLWLPSFA